MGMSSSWRLSMAFKTLIFTRLVEGPEQSAQWGRRAILALWEMECLPCGATSCHSLRHVAQIHLRLRGWMRQTQVDAGQRRTMWRGCRLGRRARGRHESVRRASTFPEPRASMLRRQLPACRRVPRPARSVTEGGGRRRKKRRREEEKVLHLEAGGKTKDEWDWLATGMCEIDESGASRLPSSFMGMKD